MKRLPLALVFAAALVLPAHADTLAITISMSQLRNMGLAVPSNAVDQIELLSDDLKADRDYLATVTYTYKGSAVTEGQTVRSSSDGRAFAAFAVPDARETSIGGFGFKEIK